LNKFLEIFRPKLPNSQPLNPNIHATDSKQVIHLHLSLHFYAVFEAGEQGRTIISVERAGLTKIVDIMLQLLLLLYLYIETL